MDMMMSSNTSNVTTPSALHHKHQEAAREEVVGARNVKAKQASGGGEHKARPQLEHALKCPRCDSSNTKFCYYNNYSMTQPRYFCKSCRRYWTQGGVLRNVPVGGACRKNKTQLGGVGSAPASASSSKNMNNITPQFMTMMPTAATSNLFPNMLPTLMSSTGGDSLPLAPLTPLGTTLFMDVLRGGSSSGMLLPSFGFGVMQLHGHGVLMGGSATSQQQQLVGPLLQGHAMLAGGGGSGGAHQWAPTDRQQGHQHQVVDVGDGTSTNNLHNNRSIAMTGKVEAEEASSITATAPSSD